MSRIRFVVVALVLSSCSSEVPEPVGKTKELAAASTAFAFKLHGELLKRNEGQNVFISPASVLFALSMAASGARGETADEMLAAMELKGWKREDLDAASSKLLRWLEGGEPAVRLNVANSAWVRQEFPFDRAYVEGLEENYLAEARKVDFASSKTLDAMNEWVKDRTQGKIAGAGPRAIDPSDALFLINAVHFKGSWQERFEKSLTQDQPFHLAGGKTKTMPFMRQSAQFGCVNAADFRGVRIPYGEKGRMVFYVVLPNEGVTLGRLHEVLSGLGPKWTSGYVPTTVRLELPRFKLAFQAQLVPALGAMGMKKPFQAGGADFTGMSPRGRELSISQVQHQTYVDVNEEGTEAAAVTTVGVSAVSVPPPPPLFKVDRPFFCAIVDDVTGTLLFTGTIVDPNP